MILIQHPDNPMVLNGGQSGGVGFEKCYKVLGQALSDQILSWRHVKVQLKRPMGLGSQEIDKDEDEATLLKVS